MVGQKNTNGNNVYNLWRQSAEKQHCIYQLAFVWAEKYVVLKTATKSYTQRCASY